MTYTDVIQIRDEKSPPSPGKPQQDKNVFTALLFFLSAHDFLSFYQAGRNNCELSAPEIKQKWTVVKKRNVVLEAKCAVIVKLYVIWSEKELALFFILWSANLQIYPAQIFTVFRTYRTGIKKGSPLGFALNEFNVFLAPTAISLKFRQPSKWDNTV